jgi:NAD(P)-dependent dehydrogenase (short-subunit alcohol dehydrogenase family)
MARILITGSSDGIGQLVARSLIAQGHEVILHARNPSRAEAAMAGAPGAQFVLVADLSSISQTKQLVRDAN